VRVLIISDIHANSTALEAVLQDAGPTDETWCLGDLVGYGPEPNVVIERVRQLPRLTCMLGNHDAAVARRVELEAFNGDARRSLTWTQTILTADNVEFLRSLPRLPEVHSDVTLAHGSPRDPTWEYILNSLTARLNFGQFSTSFCFVGHTHIQSLFQLDGDRDHISMGMTRPGEVVVLRPRVIVNPGSVGQPRDRDPRAAYAIFDTDMHTWEPRRTDYDIAFVQERIREAGLPPRHAQRLAEGS
jgi:diadenosine tetraphosphatase ApaH/serine/threonine PP2A family protein phosphatase